MYNPDDNTMPVNMITRQGKIAGINVAWGRGKWTELESGRWGYDFPEDDAFGVRVNPQTLDKMSISDDDFADTIAQIEDTLGHPYDFRLQYGLYPNQGYSNAGIVVRSRLNPMLICVYKPTSIEDKSYDGYFEWYYDEDLGVGDLSMFMDRFDKATDSQTSNILASPAMPDYQEAWEATENVLDEVARQDFLKKVWHYHKTAPRGYQIRLEAELLPIWSKVINKEFSEAVGKSKNPGFGFLGTVETAYALPYKDAEKLFAYAVKQMQKHYKTSTDTAVEFLDSRRGRHFADELSFHGAEEGSDFRIVMKAVDKALKKASWVKKEVLKLVKENIECQQA